MLILKFLFSIFVSTPSEKFCVAGVCKGVISEILNDMLLGVCYHY